jgi:predicted kinase
MPTLYMMIGVSASGKSTWLKNTITSPSGNDIISTDHYIDQYAESVDRTYNDVFSEFISQATREMEKDLKIAIDNDLDIYWDQTNLNRKTRANKLRKIPSYYKKVAVVFPIPEANEWVRRLESRPGKNIPSNILVKMVNTFVEPTLDEGFDEILEVNNG